MSRQGTAISGPRLASLGLGWGAVIAAAAFGFAYFVFVMHFALDVPVGDDWRSGVPLVDSVTHHGLSMSILWLQHENPSHLLLPNLVFVLDGLIAHFNTRVLIALNALLLIASFYPILLLFRSYLPRTNGFLTVLATACVWFSLGGMDNALWGYQIQIYLTLLFMVLTLFFLHLSLDDRGNSHLTLGAAILAALGASCSSIQGLLIWPIGLLVLLWCSGFRKHLSRTILWCGSAVAMFGIYRIGYSVASGCANVCSLTHGLAHPPQLVGYFTAVLGNAAPASDYALFGSPNVHLPIHQALGVVLLLASVVITILSYRDRHVVPVSWLPVALVGLGVLWDLTIAMARSGYGLRTALSSHYATPQILLLSGLVIFTLRRATTPRGSMSVTVPRRAAAIGWVTLLGVGSLVLAVVVSSTMVGVSDAHEDYRFALLSARVVANLDRIPPPARNCYIDLSVDRGVVRMSNAERLLRPVLQDARRDQLSTFAPSVLHHYRRLGPPFIRACR